MHQQSKIYILLTLLFLTTSGLIYLYLQQNNSQVVTQIVVNPTNVPSQVLVQSTLLPTKIPTATPTPPFTTFTSPDYFFTVVYPSYRKFFQEKSSTGQRFVFYRPDAANLVVHAGTAWSWVHPGRDLTSGSFLYETSNQIIQDLQSGKYKYTLQCVHNQNKALKLECQPFFNSFKLN